MRPLAHDLELNDREDRPACLASGPARLPRPRRRRPSCPRIGRRRGRRRSATMGLLRGICQGGPPIACAQPPRAAGMRKPRRSSLVCDPEDALVVSATRLAAGRPDQLRGAGDLRELPKGRDDAFPVQGDDLIGGRRVATRLQVERAGLPASDLRDLGPSFVAPGCAHRALGRNQIEASRGLDGRNGHRRRHQASPTIGRGAHALRESEPCLSFARPPLLVDLVLPFSLEDLDRSLGQVDRTALHAADDDLVSAARAPSRAIGRRVEGSAAVWARDRNGRFRRDRQRGRRHFLQPKVDGRLGLVEAKEPPKKPDRDHLGSLTAPAGRRPTPPRRNSHAGPPASRSGYSRSRRCCRTNLASPTAARASPMPVATTSPPTPATIRSRPDGATASRAGSAGRRMVRLVPGAAVTSRGAADATSTSLKQDGAKS